MKYLFINTVAGSCSTGRIAADMCRELQAQGNECVLAYGRWENNCEDITTHLIGTSLDYKVHGVLTRLFDLHGFGSKHATKEFLQWAEKYDPDVVWLHNIHGYYINVEMLFAWIKTRPEMEVKWTLHDCWAFTGHCSHFTAVKCDQWKSQCKHCCQLRRYPACYGVSLVSKNFERKRDAFTGVKKLTLVVPSQWLADLTRKSFLKEYPVEVHYNTIDVNVFKPTPSEFREKYGLQNKIVVLGVANVWDERKGLLDFYQLAEMLDNRYAIVLVGLNEKQIRSLPDKVKKAKRVNNAKESNAVYAFGDSMENYSAEERVEMLPGDMKKVTAPTVGYKKTAYEEITGELESGAVEPNIKSLYHAVTRIGNRKKLERSGVGCTIICIPRTNSTQELAEIYTAADVFVNPTYEDNYPTVNLEAQACGTPVITYDSGGSKETLGKMLH